MGTLSDSQHLVYKAIINSVRTRLALYNAEQSAPPYEYIDAHTPFKHVTEESRIARYKYIHPFNDAASKAEQAARTAFKDGIDVWLGEHGYKDLFIRSTFGLRIYHGNLYELPNYGMTTVHAGATLSNGQVTVKTRFIDKVSITITRRGGTLEVWRTTHKVRMRADMLSPFDDKLKSFLLKYAQGIDKLCIDTGLLKPRTREGGTNGH